MEVAASDRSSPSGFVSQSAVLVSANVASATLSAVYVAFAGRALGPVEYGALTAGLALSAFFSLIAGPFETGVTRLAIEHHTAGAVGRLRALAFGAMGRAAMVALLVAAAWIGAGVYGRGWLHLDGWNEWLALAGYAAANLLVCIPRGVQRGDHRFAGFGVNQVFESAARLGAGVLLIHAGWRAGGAMAGYAAGMAGAVLFGLWQLRDLHREPPQPVKLSAAFAFSVPMFFVYAYFFTVANIDVLAAKHHLDGVQAGVYGACSSLTRMMFLVATPVSQILFSRVAALHVSGRATHRLAVVVMAVIAVGLAVSNLIPLFFGRELMALVFGGAFAGGVATLRILWLSTSLIVLQSLAASALMGVDGVRGSWLMLFPCGLMVYMLRQRHADANQIAQAGLAAAALGTLTTLIMIAFASRRPRPAS